MEQSCHRCGAALASGTPFCSQCGAPQVRIPENLTSTPGVEGSEGLLGDEALARAASAASVNWKHALPSASSAGLATAVACTLPGVSAAFPLWMLAGGWFAVVLYRRRMPTPLLPAAAGSKVGALAGLLGFLFFAVFVSTFLAIKTMILHEGEEIRATLRAILEQAAAGNHDQQAIVQSVQTPEGLALLVVGSMILFLFLFLLFSTAGGIFAASLGRRRIRRE